MHLRALLAKIDELLLQLPPESHNDVSTLLCLYAPTTLTQKLELYSFQIV